jgi:hypothetical protein
VDAKDRPVTKAQVNLNGTNQPTGICLTDSRGHFHFDHVCEGLASVFAYYNIDGRPNSATPKATVQLKGGDTNIVIKLELTNAVPAGAPHL